jgi:hypothetical protein
MAATIAFSRAPATAARAPAARRGVAAAARSPLARASPAQRVRVVG